MRASTSTSITYIWPLSFTGEHALPINIGARLFQIGRTHPERFRCVHGVNDVAIKRAHHGCGVVAADFAQSRSDWIAAGYFAAQPLAAINKTTAEPFRCLR